MLSIHQRKKFLKYIAALVALPLVIACGSPHQIVYDNDGIYNSEGNYYYEEEPVVNNNQEVYTTDSAQNQNYYRQFFDAKIKQYANEPTNSNDVFTDVEEYSSTDVIVDEYGYIVEETSYSQNAGWGEASNLEVNVYTSPYYGFYDFYWVRPIGWYGYWGMSPWYGGWGWNHGYGYGYGYGWNSWGWNYPMWYGWGHPHYYNYYNHHHGYHNSRVAYNRGRSSTDYNGRSRTSRRDAAVNRGRSNRNNVNASRSNANTRNAVRRYDTRSSRVELQRRINNSRNVNANRNSRRSSTINNNTRSSRNSTIRSNRRSVNRSNTTTRTRFRFVNHIS